jgi:hypothetical protein
MLQNTNPNNIPAIGLAELKKIVYPISPSVVASPVLRLAESLQERFWNIAKRNNVSCP